MDAETGRKTSQPTIRLMVGLFLAARLMTFLALPLEGLLGYGDFIHFYRLAALPGWPYLHAWMEFPPIFPMLCEILYRLGGGQEHVFDYLLALTLTLADAGNLLLLARLAGKIHPPAEALRRAVGYWLVLATLAYGWWYFDPLAVLALLLGLNGLVDCRAGSAGLALGGGVLVKLFPGLALAAAWKLLPWKQALKTTLITLGVAGAVYGGLWLASPQFTRASLISQGAKGSWETVWALVDGNLRTGNFGPESERLTAETAGRSMGNPARIPTWATLLVFGAVGLWGWLRADLREDAPRRTIALVGWTWSLFLPWSPGWSPQWILYLLPLIILALPERMAVLMGVTLIFANLMEWPVLLSRGMFWSLLLTVPLRTLLLALLAVLFYQTMTGQDRAVNRVPIQA